MRTRSILAVVALLALAGCVGTPVHQPLAGSENAPADPASDQLGWEQGYWYNESLGLTTDDGLNQSEFQAVVNRAMARDEHVRGIEFQKPVPVDVITREKYRQQYTGGGGSTPASVRTFDNVKFQSLFLVGKDENSLSVQRSNQGSSVLGFYSPSNDQIVIVTNGENAVIDELTLAHELGHALQFRNFKLNYQSPTRDAANAHSGLIEGDARYLENRYEAYCGQEWQCVKPEPKSGSESSSGGGLNLGVYIVKYFPYSDGPGFIDHLKQHGGWAAVNDAYENPPDTAKEVALPATYPDGVHNNVSLADTSSQTWDRVTVPGRAPYGEVGVAGITAMIAYPSYDTSKQGGIVKPQTFLNYKPNGEVNSDDPFNYTNRFASGWTGDKLHVYENSANETAYVWRLTWESNSDARTFASGYRRVLSYWGGQAVNDANTLYRIPDGGFRGAYYLQVSERTTTIVYAPELSGLDDVRAGTPTAA